MKIIFPCDPPSGRQGPRKARNCPESNQDPEKKLSEKNRKNSFQVSKFRRKFFMKIIFPCDPPSGRQGPRKARNCPESNQDPEKKLSEKNRKNKNSFQVSKFRRKIFMKKFSLRPPQRPPGAPKGPELSRVKLGSGKKLFQEKKIEKISFQVYKFRRKINEKIFPATPQRPPGAPKGPELSRVKLGSGKKVV